MRAEQEFDRSVSVVLRRVAAETEDFAGEAEFPACLPLASQTASGFGPYSNAISTLPAADLQKIRKLAAAIRGSFQPGCERVVTVRLVGHSDRDKRRGFAYERKISGERAAQVRDALIRFINSPALSAQIQWEVVPGGSTQLVVENASVEPQKRRNRRVQMFPRTASAQAALDQQVESVLRTIQQRAQAAAARPRSVAGSNFARVIDRRYLATYLANPNQANAKAALDAIGAQNKTGLVRQVCGVPDTWEASAPSFNGSAFPPLLKLIPGFEWLPDNFGAATDILRLENRCRAPFPLNCSPDPMSHIDVDFLIGRYTIDWFDCKTKVERKQDPDLQFDNSKNESQLMHWATGVRFSGLSRDRLRELFLGYEKFHLEQWDVFGPDPLNDMIAEDAGRHMGKQIRNLRMNRSNLIATLDAGFRQARAWVGALLRLRRQELDQQIRSDPPPSLHWHWTAEVPPTNYQYHPFSAPAIRQMFASGWSMQAVLDSPLVNRYVEVYTLPLETAIWEKTNGPVPVSSLQLQMVSGALDAAFKQMAYNEQNGKPPLPSREAEYEAEGEGEGWLQGCTPCIRGQKFCHKSIVPDDGKCHPLWFDTWVCYC